MLARIGAAEAARAELRSAVCAVAEEAGHHHRHGHDRTPGGTDVRANTTVATAINGTGPGKAYAITGHKWFLSAPMSDAFLVLAQAKGGLSCFHAALFALTGRSTGSSSSGSRTSSATGQNGSAEVSFDRAVGYLISEEGRGVQTIIDMVTLTRLDCAVSSAGLMRQALARAIHHAQHRSVFQKKLIDQPLMLQVLADMALDVEAATALAFKLAASFDGHDDPDAAAYRRLMTPVTKYWVCKIAPPLVYEAMECLGGNAYVEEGGFPLLYREVPVNAIWEGSGNVMCLDVLRAVERSPETLERVLAGIEAASGGEQRLKSAVDGVRISARRSRAGPGEGAIGGRAARAHRGGRPVAGACAAGGERCLPGNTALRRLQAQLRRRAWRRGYPQHCRPGGSQR